MRSGARGRGRAVLGLLLLALCAGSVACGRYGPPVRAEEYREKEKEKREAEAARRRQSPESQNEPLPAAP